MTQQSSQGDTDSSPIRSLLVPFPGSGKDTRTAMVDGEQADAREQFHLAPGLNGNTERLGTDAERATDRPVCSLS